MLRCLLMIACLTFLACSASAVVIPPGESTVRDDWWVDVSRREAGDGSRARPFGSLAEALERVGQRGPVLRVHLLPGRYEGPFVLPAGLELMGEGAVLHGAGAGPVVRAAEGALLRGLGVQGGSWGLEAAGPVRLESVRFRGQATGAVRVEGGRLVVVGGGFEAGAAGSVGLQLEAGAHAEVREAVFTGAFRRGVEAKDAVVELESVRFQGLVTALHQARGRVRLRHVVVEGGPEVGLFVQRGTLLLEDVTVTGHEYGLQALEATVEGRGFTSVRASRAGVALIGTRGTLEETVVLGSGGFGALSLVGSEMVLRGVRVDGADAYGIAATRGRVRLERVVITRLTSREGDSGDGLHLRDAELVAEGLVVRGVAGAGVLAAQGSRVVLRDVLLESCKEAGVWAETLAKVTAEGLEVRGSEGPALVAMEDGVIRVDALTARDNAAGLVMADCQGGTGVKLGRVVGQGIGQGPAQGAAGAGAACVVKDSP